MRHDSWLMCPRIESVQRHVLHASCVLTHGSCVHAPRVMRPRVHVLTHASGVHAPRVHASCVLTHAPRVMLHVSCVMRHASCVMAHALSPFSVMRHASTLVACVMRPLTWHASCVHSRGKHSAAPFSSIQPPGMAPGISHRLDPPINALNLAPLSYMAWGNRVVLPPVIQRNGAKQERKRKTTTGRGAQRSAAACCRSNEKGRHNAGPVHG